MAAPTIEGFELAGTLYEGPRSTVWRGQRVSDGRAVVIKLLTAPAPSHVDLTRYRYSKEITDSLSLGGIAQNLELLDVGGRPALVGEDIGGASLGHCIEAGADRQTLVRALAAAAETLGGLHAGGVIHRDVNPSNIVFDASTGRTQLIDFELATEVPREQVEAAPPTRLEGTLAYIAPEQTGRTGRPVDHRADLYSLGASLFQALTGRRVFEARDRLGLVHAHLAEQPPNPRSIDPTISESLAAITLKLLEKQPADRYQSGFGVARDLERCLAGEDGFELGSADVPPWLQFGKELFGRAEESAALAAAFERAAAGRAELMLVAGYSGVGKSSLVMEVQGAVGRVGGRFVEGKQDQLSNVPFAAWIDVVQSIVRDALAAEESVLGDVRARAQVAAEGVGQVLIDLAPDVELLIGPQPKVAELPAGEAQNRFQQAMVRFVTSFATVEQPLVVFLDDLQWADRPSLLLLERIVADPAAAHLLLVGAYRDNEVPEGHPLLRTVTKLHEVDAPLATLELLPLPPEANAQLVASAVDRPLAQAAPLADLVFRKTGGNPFFAERFLMTLAEEGALAQRDGSWHWDLARIEAMGFTENVVDLMTRRIERLDPQAQKALRVAAAVGNRFDLTVLATVLGSSPALVAQSLWEALRDSVVVPHTGDYRYAGLASAAIAAAHPDATRVEYAFVHDRIQEAAYNLTPKSERAALHLAIGRTLQARSTDAGESLFAVATQMNQGLPSLADSERRTVLELNIEAGKRALAGAAYPAALGFFDAAGALFDDDAWDADYDLAFAHARGIAEAARMGGDYARSKEACDQAIAQGRDSFDRVRAQLDKMAATSIEGDHMASIEVGLAALEELGFERPADEAAWGALGQEEGALLMAAIGEGGIDGLADRPELTDPRILLETEVLAGLNAPSAVVPHIYGVVVTRFARLFAEHGLGPLAAQAFAGFGLLNAFIREYDAADAFGKLGVRLSEQPRFAPTRAAVLMMYSCWIAHWKHPMSAASEYAREAVDVGVSSGAFDWGGWAAMNLPTQWLADGIELERAIARTREIIATSRNVLQFDDSAWIAYGGLHPMLQLMGRQDELDALDAAGLDEASLHGKLAHYPMMRPPMYTGQMWASVVLGDLDIARQCIADGKDMVLYGGGLCHVADFVFLEALTVLMAGEGPLTEAEHGIVDAALPQLDAWAGHCAANHALKPLLVRAELARRKGESPSDLYEQAIEAATESGKNHHLGLSLERAGRHLVDHGRDRAARGYLADARLAYLHWGATAKAQALADEFPFLAGRGVTMTAVTSATALGSTSAGGVSLDADALLKATTAISTELRLDAMLQIVMNTVLQVAGAERGSLLLNHDGELRLAAQAEGPGINLAPAVDPLPYSDAIVRYVVRTQGQVVLADASTDRRFGGTAYVRARRPRSVLCQAVVKQNELIAVLYLENNLAADGFTESRCRMTSVLSSQAAVSLENSLLFEEQRQLNESMQRFLPNEFLRTLGHRKITEIRLGEAVQKDMTVLFTDIRSFTSVSEQMSPEEIFAYLNAYLGKVGPVIRAHGGFIDKYIGDAIMALFPTADAAVAAGQQIAREVLAHNAELRAADLPEMKVGIGVHSGSLMLGTIGEPERIDGTVISDAVNIASRVESLTKQLDVTLLVTGETAEQLTGDVKLEFVDARQLRGRQGDTRLYKVV